MDALRVFFEELSTYEEPRATRFVREAAGVDIRDADANVVDLPSYMTKRGLYSQFCWYRGIKVSSTHKGNPTRAIRSDEAWKEENSEPLPCPSWTTFRRFWNREYSHLRIQRPVKDICNDCYRFYLGNRTQASKNKKNAVEDGSGDDDSSVSTTSTDEDIYGPPLDKNRDTTTTTIDQTSTILEPDAPIAEAEMELLKASIHVEDARAQRNYVRLLRQQAIDSTRRKLPVSQATFLFYFDYAQNIQCPFFGAQQPGETYYYSPLSINVFGITDSCHEEERLHAYCYHEGEGTKGGNNVVSMLHKYLREQKGMPRSIGGDFDEFKEGPWGGHLVLVCDNCSGQNKNRMVIRYVVYLVETLKFCKVSLVFLVAGHTKNPCDRLFNLLKKGYRQKNLFDVDQTVSALNENEFTTAERFRADGFRDWDAFFNRYYSVPHKVKKYHIFEVDATSNATDPRTVMTFRQSNRIDAEIATQQFKRRDTAVQADRDLVLKTAYDFPKKITPLGIRSIKKNELWKKFKKFVPAEYHNSDIYQEPSNQEKTDLIERQAEREASRALEKAGRAKRQADSIVGV